jgi:hypothetical protein
VKREEEEARLDRRLLHRLAYIHAATYVWVWDNGGVVETPCEISFRFEPPHVYNVGFPSPPDGAIRCVEHAVRVADMPDGVIRTFQRRDLDVKVVNGIAI